MKSYQRFPDNEEFRREFFVKDIYNFRESNYLLLKLENPNLSLAWQKDLAYLSKCQQPTTERSTIQ